MTALAYSRCGAGAPLVLLHGLGSARGAWDPVVPALAERFDVLAVDLPGFGGSAPTPPSVEPHPAALAAAVAGFLDGLGIPAPHIVGNSLGGWVALELAGICPPASVTLLSPAGLWRARPPLYCRASLRATRWLSQHAGGFLSGLVRFRLGRGLVLGQTHGRPFRMSPDYARAAIEAMGTCPGFDATFTAHASRRYVAGRRIDAPVTVAFGSRDMLLLPHQSRHLDELPPGRQLERLPGCGHVPMADDPAAVVALITMATARARPGGTRAAAQSRDTGSAEPLTAPGDGRRRPRTGA
jgi:pimeloyl-ACP methyl ester carboxylesterase